MERTAEKRGRRGRKKKDTEGKKDVKARDGENLKKKINSKLALTVVAPGDEPGGKLTLH